MVFTPALYTLTELAFAAYSYLKWSRYSAVKVDFQCTREEAWSTFNQALEVLRSHYDVKSWLCEWFQGAPFCTIHRDNVLELLAHAMLHMDR